jgi:hypothetical protein
VVKLTFTNGIGIPAGLNLPAGVTLDAQMNNTLNLTAGQATFLSWMLPSQKTMLSLRQKYPANSVPNTYPLSISQYMGGYWVGHIILSNKVT